VVTIGSCSGDVGNQLVADKAEEESCSRATADDDNAVRRQLSRQTLDELPIGDHLATGS